MKFKERHIQKQIMTYLRLKGWLVIKSPTSGIYQPSVDRWITLGQKGIADLLCCSPSGRFVAIEVKRPGGKVTPHQKIFLDQVAESKGIAILAYSLDDVIAKIPLAL